MYVYNFQIKNKGQTFSIDLTNIEATNGEHCIMIIFIQAMN